MGVIQKKEELMIQKILLMILFHLNMKLVLKNFLNYFQVYLKEIVNGLFLMMYQNLEIWMMILNLFLTFMNFGEILNLGENSLLVKKKFDLEEAECREEKRWMERENKKLTKKMKKEENGRLIYLVNLSYKYDPRIINWKEEQEKEKLRKKAERKAAKIRRREEKKENEVKQRAIENKQIRKKRPQLRKICRLAREEHDSDPINNPFNPLEEHVEILCKEMNLKQFNVLIKSLQNENGPSSFRNMIIEYNVITPDDSYGLNSLEEDKEADGEPIPNQTVMVEQ